jgi:hypothetical protein
MEKLYFTKAQRHKIYKEALSLYKVDVKNKCQYGICLAMCVAIKKMFPDIHYPSIIYPNESLWRENHNQYPEIMEYKPANCGDYWWYKSETAPRIAALEGAIEASRRKKRVHS